MKFMLIGLLVLTGCATNGADAARQSEANVNTILGAGYRASKLYVQIADADAVQKGQVGKDAEAQAELNQTKKVSKILLQIMDTASEATDAQDAAIIAAEAAKQKDFSGIIGALIRIGTDVVKAFGDNGIKIALPGVK